MALAANQGSPYTEGASLQQQTYTMDWYYEDEWYAIHSDEVTLLALLDENGGSRGSYINTVEYIFQQETHNTWSNIRTQYVNSWTKDAMLYQLQSSNIFFIHTHGQQTGIIIGSDGSLLTMDDLNNVDLSNLKLAVLLTCETAKGYSDLHIANNIPVNIVEKMVLCGAETVIGFDEKTMTSDCNEFAVDLAEWLIYGDLNVNEAIGEAKKKGYTYQLHTMIVVSGNRYNRIREE